MKRVPLETREKLQGPVPVRVAQVFVFLIAECSAMLRTLLAAASVGLVGPLASPALVPVLDNEGSL